MAVFNNILAGASGQTTAEAGAYQISRSVRLNSADSAYFSRTPASAGNRKTWTWAGWVKRSGLTSGADLLFAVYQDSSNRGYISFQASTDKILLFNRIGGTDVYEYSTNAVFRDASAWYHIVVAFDTAQSTASDRVKLYVNDAEQSLTATTTASQNLDTLFNAAQPHYLGRDGSSQYFDGYLADIHFIDGQALDPTSFTEVDATTGQLVPKAFVASGPNDGTTWSSLTSGGTVNGSYPMSNTFDGSTTTTGVRAVSGGGFIFGGSLGISYSSSIRIHSGISGVGTQKFKLNDGPEIDFAENTWVTVASGSGTLNKLEITAGTTGNANIYLGAVEVDGVVLIDGDTANIGVNGFHLPFSDNSTAAALGTDTSGNSNTWTVNNISVAAGSGNDSLVDTPTNYGTGNSGGDVRGNYATLNPLSSQGGTLSNGNLNYTGTNLNFATIAVASGKWYWEITNTGTLDDVNNTFLVGVASNTQDTNTFTNKVQFYSQASQSVIYRYSGSAIETLSGTTLANGDVLGIALDLDSGTQAIQFYKNGSTVGSLTSLNDDGKTWTPSVKNALASIVINFGQRPFAYTAPSGFKALCTANLPAPVVAKPSEVMDVVLYTGNGSTQTISGLGFSPDFVWIKSRSGADNHAIQDAVRGATYVLQSNTTNAEVNAANTVGSFTSDGFTLAGGAGSTNGSSVTYAAWTWDAGSSTASNPDGSITSQVRANPSAGFSIVTYTSSSSVSTVGHGLGVAPHLIITKNRSVSNTWWTYHSAIGNTKAMRLDTTAAETTISSTWNNTSPTSTVFTVGGEWGSGNSIVAYCFAPVAGYSSFGSYTGNGSGSPDGPFIYTGFRPRWILFKNTNTTNGWRIMDTSINPYNVVSTGLYPHVANGEDSATNWQVDYLSNGFKVRCNAAQAEINGSGNTIIYAAFAEHPFQTARAR